MIEIHISDHYRIATDSLNWIVERGSTTKDGNTRWRAISFHSTLESAASSLGNRMVRESNAKGVAEVLAQLENVRDTLLHALAGKYEVTVGISEAAKSYQSVEQ